VRHDVARADDPGVGAGGALGAVVDLLHADDRLHDMGVADDGTIHLEPVQSWLSRRGLEAERRTPGSSADAVVWADVTQRAHEESELNWTYLSFMTLATLLASIAIILDSLVWSAASQPASCSGCSPRYWPVGWSGWTSATSPAAARTPTSSTHLTAGHSWSLSSRRPPASFP
jgi:hypothetical protein